MAEVLNPFFLGVGRKLKKSIKSRTSVLQGKKVEYFKGKDFVLLLSKLKSLNVESKTLEFKTSKNITDLADELLDNYIIKKVEPEYREGDKRNPVFLKPTNSRKFDSNACYVWNPQVQQVRWQGIFLIFLVLGIVAACCFPIWPISAKLGVWYLSVILLCVILGITVIRYIAFILLFIVGYDFWILPNMYDDKAGFWDTLTPLYFFRKRDDSKCQIGVRVTVFILVVAVCGYTYMNPEVIEAIQELSLGGISELVAWGEEKILSNSTQISGIPNYSKYDHILKEDEPLNEGFNFEDEVE